MLRPSGRSFTTGGEQYRLRQSGKSRAAQRLRPDVRYRKLSEFHASRQRPLRISPGQCRLYRQGVTPCVVDELRVERNADHFNAALLEFFITFIEGDQLRRANKSEVHRPEEQNGRFTIGVLFEVEFINNLTATQYRRSGEIRGLTVTSTIIILLQY